MIAELAITSLLLAAADVEPDDDLLSRFRLLRTMLDLDGAYALLMDDLDETEQIEILSKLKSWVQASSDLDELKVRIEEYQAAWKAFSPFETNAQNSFRRPLVQQFQDVFISSLSFQDDGLPWFGLERDVGVQREVRRMGKAFSDADARVFMLPHWTYRISRDEYVYVPDMSRGNVFSADRDRALIGEPVRVPVWAYGKRRVRTTFQFSLVAHEWVTLSQ